MTWQVGSNVGGENGMEIRRATPDDAAVLARIHIDSWRSAYRGLVPDSHLARLDYERRARWLRESLGENAEETYVADLDGEIVGFVTLGACRDADVDQETTGEIWGIYLAPGHWRKGIGSLLCHFGERTLRLRGYVLATLWVFAANDQARRFYEAMGFKADGASKTLNPGAPLEAVRYRKPLADTEPSPRGNDEDRTPQPGR